MIFTAMAKKKCDNDEKEDILRRLEAGDLSEDDCESDGDELDFYPTREDLLHVLEEDTLSDEQQEDPMPDEDIGITDPPIILVTTQLLLKQISDVQQAYHLITEI